MSAALPAGLTENAQIWEPLPGSQRAYLICPVFETLFSGNRGPGKTMTLLMDFAQECGKGYGAAWRGVIFRRKYKELADVIAKSYELFRVCFPEARFYESPNKYYWEWPDGERLMFRHFAKAKDYWDYHGHEIPFIGWEELTNWEDDDGYKAMMSCCRSTTPGMPRKYRATTNPYGPGHSWIKQRFRLEGCPRNYQMRTPIIKDAVDEEGEPLPHRVTIFGYLHENTILLAADPGYPTRIRSSASNSAMADAWMSGSWDIVAGGLFEEDWDRDVHILPNFPLPKTWRFSRGYDYGSKSPFAVVWFAESDGSDYQDHNGDWRSTVRGDIFVIREWYGWTGEPNKGKGITMNKTAIGIIEREISWGLDGFVNPGPSDSKLYEMQNGTSLAMEMAKPVRLTNGQKRDGVEWIRAIQVGGSRANGWKMVSERLSDAKRPENGGVRERPGLFILDCCPQAIRTLSTLPRDEVNMDDCPKSAEDHIPDVIRYEVLGSTNKGDVGSAVGL